MINKISLNYFCHICYFKTQLNLKMKFAIRIVLFFFITLFSLLAEAQITDKSKTSALPVKYFPADVFRTRDISLINEWIIKAAKEEILFLDKIKETLPETDKESGIKIDKKKYILEFISGNTGEVIRLNSESGLEPAEFALYAKIIQDSPENVENRFVKAFSDKIREFPADQKIIYTGNFIRQINRSNKTYLDEIKLFSKEQNIPDTSLFRLFQSYSYLKFYPGIRKKLDSYISRIITDNFTREDSLKGGNNPERLWWDVMRYDISVKPDIENKTISGSNVLTYIVKEGNNTFRMQIDLQEPMKIDSVISQTGQKINLLNIKNVWYADIEDKQQDSENYMTIYFHGKPKESKFPPWDGGWVWSKDSSGNPWISAVSQSSGASLWFPCKDLLSDEPDKGASLTMTIPEDLNGVSNGRLVSDYPEGDGMHSVKWEVVNPINSYNIIPYIGKYKKISDSFNGEKGKLDIDLWVLNYNIEKAETHSLPEIKRMLTAFEYWLGPYPFYEDSYKLVDAPYAGMEHQSAVAYGNRYMNGFWGNDISGTGWGKKWDYILVHESGHEWFGNSITDSDIADMWIHEGFTSYTETLFTEYWYGRKAADEYNHGTRRNIVNTIPVIGFYNVNKESINSDIYAKGSNLIHTIRNSMNDDDKFRKMLRGLCETFYHSTAGTQQVENYISNISGFDFSKVFDQYLRSTDIPVFEYYFDNDGSRVNFRYVNCVTGFNLPLTLRNEKEVVKLFPDTEWQSAYVTSAEKEVIDEELIESLYYVCAFRTRE